jgi:hypothetical protein
MMDKKVCATPNPLYGDVIDVRVCYRGIDGTSGRSFVAPQPDRPRSPNSATRKGGVALKGLTPLAAMVKVILLSLVVTYSEAEERGPADASCRAETVGLQVGHIRSTAVWV